MQSYHTCGHSKQDSIPKKFIARAREKRDQGEDYTHWVKAARIINRIQAGMTPGYRRKRPRKSSRKGRRDA